MTFAHGVILWALIHKFVAALAWPLTVVVLALMFRDRLRGLLDRVRSAKLPWGAELDFERQARDVEQKAIELEREEGGPRLAIDAPRDELDQLNSRLSAHGLKALSSNFDLQHYYTIAQLDPKLALAAVRIDLEAMLDNLMKHYQITKARRVVPLTVKADLLLRGGYVTPTQYSIFRDIIPLANSALHGDEPALSSTNSVITAFGALLDDYAAWVQQNLQ